MLIDYMVYKNGTPADVTIFEYGLHGCLLPIIRWHQNSLSVFLRSIELELIEICYAMVYLTKHKENKRQNDLKIRGDTIFFLLILIENVSSCPRNGIYHLEDAHTPTVGVAFYARCLWLIFDVIITNFTQISYNFIPFSSPRRDNHSRFVFPLKLPQI